MMLLTLIVMDILTGMEFDLFVPSFPELQSHFDISPFWVEALLSVNFIGFFFSLFIVASLADRYGRKPVILAGLAIFILGSCLCLWAWNYRILLTGRFLQGLGIASPSILSFVIIADSYDLKQQQRFMAILNGLMNISAGAAPVLGSYITMYFNWHGNFATLLLMGLITSAMAIFFIPAGKKSECQEPATAGGYISIFKSKTLMFLIISLVFSFVPYWVFVGMSPLLYMKDLGVSLAEFGYYQGSFAFIFALGSVFYGLIINKYDQRKMLYISNLIWFFSLIMITLACMMNCRSPLLIMLAFLPYVIGQIIPTTILYPLCVNLMPEAKARVSAIIQGARLILSGLSLQIAGFYYTGSFQNIGMIMSIFITFAIVSMFLIFKNRELMKFVEEQPHTSN